MSEMSERKEEISDQQIKYRAKSLTITDEQMEAIPDTILVDCEIMRWKCNANMITIYCFNKQCVELVIGRKLRISTKRTYIPNETYEMRNSGYGMDYTKLVSSKEEMKSEVLKIIEIAKGLILTEQGNSTVKEKETISDDKTARNRQPQWNVYEAAILMNAYQMILSDKMTRKEAVEKVSSQLRRMAQNNGIIIDDTYRNKNGINMRFYELEYVTTDGKKGLKNTSALLKKIVDLFVNNYDGYCSVLDEAEKMSDQFDTTKEFEEWLKKNEPKVEFKRILRCFDSVDAFCEKNGLLEKPLILTRDFESVKKVYRTIEKNKVFRVKNRKHFNDILRAVKDYLEFSRRFYVDNEHENSTVKESIKTEKLNNSCFHEGDFKEWLIEEGMAESTCRSYTSALHSAERYARENGLDGIEFTNASFESIKESISRLMSNEGFLRLNQEQHNRFSGAFLKLKCYIGDENNNANSTIAEMNEEKGNSDISQVSRELERILLENKDGITKEELQNALKEYSSRQIKPALDACHAVCVLKKYYHRENIFDYEEMANTLLDVINKQFELYGNYTSALQLYNEVRIRLDDFFFYNGAFDSKAEIYDLALHLFSQERYKGNSFIFLNNMHIWKEEPDYPKDFRGLMIKYAREHGDTFTRDEAVEYFEWLGSATPAQTFSYMIFNTGSSTFLQYDENSFVLAEALDINNHFLNYLKTQLGNLLEGEDYVAFGEIDEFFYTTLPKLPACVYWTALLLEDILRVYNLDYFTVEAGKDNDKKTIPAALIKKNSAYKSFADVVWAEISKDFLLPKEFAASEFRDYLLEKGFIRGSEKMWSVHKTVAGDIRFFWTNNYSKVTIN